MTRICFVCLGNICRSPLAEGVFKHLAAQAGHGAAFYVESAGLGSWHVGEAPDSRAQHVAQAHGVTLDSRARQFRAADFERFDLVLALDDDIHSGLLELAPSAAAQAKVHYLRDYDPAAGPDREVPDPYYGNQRLFEHTYTLIESACRGLLAELAAGR
jgi:protein-tyrosine phosphatase